MLGGFASRLRGMDAPEHAYFYSARFVVLRVAEFTVGGSTAKTCGEYSADAGRHVIFSLLVRILPLPELGG